MLLYSSMLQHPGRRHHPEQRSGELAVAVSGDLLQEGRGVPRRADSDLVQCGMTHDISVLRNGAMDLNINFSSEKREAQGAATY